MDVGAAILIIEDEPDIASAVADRLRSHGFEATIANDGLRGVELCAELEPDLVILDLTLPGLDGLEVCRRIQANRRVPVLMLTARQEETDVIVGLAVGADDYLTKPFSPRELVARVQAILRRVAHREPNPVFIVGGARVDPSTRQVMRGEEAIHLTATEFDLLVALAAADGAVRSRVQLLFDVWGYRDGSGARTVDSHIRALRRKLGDDVVRTVHGVGYALGAG